MSRPLEAWLVRRWLIALLAIAALHTAWFHLAPPRVTVAAVPRRNLPGEPLPALPGWQEAEAMQVASASQRRRLADGHTLLLTNLASGTIEGFQLASFTRRQPALQLGRRILIDTPQGQIAAGSIQGRPAAQTCRIGSRGAVTAASMVRLFPRERQFSAPWFAGVFGLRPPPILRCMLVTLVASEPASPSAAPGAADPLAVLQEQLPDLLRDQQPDQLPDQAPARPRR